jgi:hypothetical protein
LAESSHIGAQSVTLPLSTTAEQKPEPTAAGTANLALRPVEIALHAGAAGTRPDLTELARFMLKLPADAGIGLRTSDRKDDGGKGSDQGGKNGNFLHILRSFLLKPPWQLAQSTQVRRNGSNRIRIYLFFKRLFGERLSKGLPGAFPDTSGGQFSLRSCFEVSNQSKRSPLWLTMTAFVQK